MNYLSHYFHNHHVSGIPVQPAFVAGVALPDLWRRFSRTERIRWRHVRALAPTNPDDTALRDGLLNHVAADEAFHCLPAFLEWQHALKSQIRPHKIHSAVLDFVTHVAIELTLDRQLLREDPDLSRRFYEQFAQAADDELDRRLAQVTGADTTGMSALVHQFIERRFLDQYSDAASLSGIVQRMLEFIKHPIDVPNTVLREIFDAADASVRHDVVWATMQRPIHPLAVSAAVL